MNMEKNRSIVKTLAVITVVILTITATFACGAKLVEEPCAWCNHSPSVEYTTANGTTCYVCEECSSECMICGNEATEHYTNLLDAEMFVCADCYAEVKDSVK